jgi:eukaryotic-like serine/threonine-protein kinase
MGQSSVLAGRYLLERRAGAGGMGEVWKAIDRETDEPVAVKRLPGDGPQNAARFAREAQVLSSLSHPHVVRYLEHGSSAEGAPYLVMEWLEGEDLAARLSRGPLSVDENARLTLCVAEALSEAHARGVVHRDLKPSNLFLVGGQIEAVKVLDFGLARAVNATRMTASGVLLGTVAYMAPEQARGEPSLDARADVFSLGCVLFECLTGERAFGGEDVVAVLTKVLFEETPSARCVKPELPEALEALLQRMLAKGRDERPQDGAAVAAALRALRAMPSGPLGEPVRAPSLTKSEQRSMAVILIGAPAEEEASTVPMVEATTVELQGDEALVSEAERYGGVGERLLDGSVVVIVTGAGLATDLCAQAARCALSLRALAGGRPIALAMGRGERAGRPLGSAVDRVARLASTSARARSLEGVVAIDEVVAGLLDARFEVREGEGLFTLHGERALGEGARLLLGKPTPCVGRERELGTLRALFTESVEGLAQAVVVIAPPGVGKSRLAQEFVEELRARGEEVSIWTARGDALRAGSPLGMLSEALRCACGLRESEPVDLRRNKLLAHVGAWLSPGEERRVAEFVGELVGAPFPDEESLPLCAARRDTQQMADQVRAALLDLLAAACAKQPVLLLLEDLHWGDRPTVQLLDVALRELACQPLFVLALARPEVREVFPRLWEGRRLHRLRCNELNRRAGEQLARHVLGPGADAEMIARIVRLSQGNAFYLEELIRWTAEGKGADVPETVVAMVQSHLGVLADEDRRILRASSIFGETFWAGGVAALLGNAEARAVERLAALVQQELLVERKDSRLLEEQKYAFRHALVREGAYAMLTDEDRALGHRLAGAWLEAQREPDAVVLAEHFEKGGAGARAGVHWGRAAERASWGGDAARAIAYLERGLACPVSAEVRIKLLGTLCETHFYRFNMAGAALPYAEELLRTAEPGGAPWAQALLIKLICAAQARKGDDFAEALCELLATAIQPEAMDLAMITLGTTCYLLDLSGDVSRAEASFERLEALTRPALDRTPGAAAFCDLVAAGRSSHAKDRPWAGLLRGRSALARARAIDHKRYAFAAHVLMGMNAWFLGAHAEARRLFREVHIADEELAFISSIRPFTLAWMSADLGSLGEAREWAERLIAAGRARALLIDEGLGRWALAEVLRRAEELEAADREIEAALAVLSQTSRLDHPGALATLAALRLAQGRAAEALAAAEEGLAIYGSSGACSQFCRGAFLRLVHAECLAATGSHEAAKTAIAKARERLFAMADNIGDPDYKKSFLDAPENRRTLELARAWLGEPA